MSVMRLGYVHIRVTDLEEARDHYSNTLGMSVVHEEPGRLHLKCWDEWDHHSLVLEEGGVGLVKVGYKCSSEDDLAEFEKRCSQFGATTGRFSRGENMTVGDGVRVTLPSEHTLELFSEMEFTGTDTGSINPEAWPRDMRGVGGHWIDHALIAAEDPGLVERFFMECLDFRPAERVVESIEHPDVIGTWMTCGDSPHDLAVIKGPNAKLHHFAFHLEDWGAILRAGDIFSMDDSPTAGRTGTASPGVRRSTSSTPRATATRCSPAWATGSTRTSRRSTGRWTSSPRGSSTTHASSTNGSPPCSHRTAPRHQPPGPGGRRLVRVRTVTDPHTITGPPTSCTGARSRHWQRSRDSHESVNAILGSWPMI